MKRYSQIFGLVFLFCLPTNLYAKVILVLGDSISAAYGMDIAQGWVHLLETRLQERSLSSYTVVNASISGSTSADGLGRLPALLEEHHPTVVVVELGGNDGLRGYPIKLMRENLQKIISMAEEAGAKVLLAGIEIPPNYGQRYTESFRKAYQDLANKNPVVFLPFILKGVATQTQLMQKDFIHPKPEAQPQLLENVWGYLEPLLVR